MWEVVLCPLSVCLSSVCLTCTATIFVRFKKILFMVIRMDQGQVVAGIVKGVWPK